VPVISVVSTGSGGSGQWPAEGSSFLASLFCGVALPGASFACLLLVSAHFRKLVPQTFCNS
jgi:hypothetical protein